MKEKSAKTSQKITSYVWNMKNKRSKEVDFFLKFADADLNILRKDIKLLCGRTTVRQWLLENLLYCIYSDHPNEQRSNWPPENPKYFSRFSFNLTILSCFHQTKYHICMVMAHGVVGIRPYQQDEGQRSKKISF